MSSGSDSIEHIDNYDKLMEDLPSYHDMTNQLVSRPREHYRWIRERLVYGWDYSKLTRCYAKEFNLQLSQAAWTVKGEVGRLSGKLMSFLINSMASELVALARVDLIFQEAVSKGNLELALNAQREINQMTFRHKAKYKAPSGTLSTRPKRGPKKLTQEEKAVREGVRKAVKSGTKAAEWAAKTAVLTSMGDAELSSLTDEELLRTIQKRRMTADGVVINQDQHGNTIPVIDAEMAARLIGGNSG